MFYRSNVRIRLAFSVLAQRLGYSRTNAVLLLLLVLPQTWDPVLITSQIVCVQCLFYISLGILQAITLGA
jgi:hypothetical protein